MGKYFQKLWLALCIAFLPEVLAQTTNDSLFSELLPLIPTCALPCVLTSFSKSPDVLTNPKTSCTNVALQAPLSACVQSACSFADQARLGVVNQRLCEGVPVDRSRITAMIIVQCTFGGIAILCVILRTYTRQRITKQMGADDWTMLAAGMLLAAVIGMNFHNMLDNGFGLHYWNLNIQRVTPLLKLFFASQIIYIIEISLIKISILLFYLRVFPGHWFRIASWSTFALVITSSVAIILPIIFQCSPMRGAWDRSISSKCIDINLLTYGAGGIAVGLDLIILLLPIPDLIKLNMSRRKKIHVLLMFSVGSLACIASIVRLKYLGDFATSTDATWDNVIGIMVSLVEICVGMICACLPAMRALFCHLFPKIFGREASDAANYPSQPISRKRNPFDKYVHDPDPTTNSRSHITATSQSIHQDRSSYDKLSPIGTDEIRLTTRSPSEGIASENRTAWFDQDGYITQNQEFVQDVEKDSRARHLLRQDGVTRNQTVTTRIWGEASPQTPLSPASRPSHLQKLKSRTMERVGSGKVSEGDGQVDMSSRQGSESSMEGKLNGSGFGQGSQEDLVDERGGEKIGGHDRRRDVSAGEDDIEMQTYRRRSHDRVREAR